MFALYFDEPLQHARASDEQRNQKSPLYTARLSLSLILDAFYTVKAVLVSWTRGGRYHSKA